MFNYLVMGLLTVLALALAAARGPRAALWWIWPIGVLLVPTQVGVPLVGGFILEGQTLPVLLLVIPLLASRNDRAPRWGLCDAMALALYATQNASDLANQKYATLTWLMYLCLWLGPYLIGRLYLSGEADLARALRPLAAFLAIAAVSVILESVGGYNLLRILTGQKGAVGGARRLGLYRAKGGMAHPIFLGMTLTLMMPLALAAARRARDRAGPTWWLGLPALLLAAIFGALSRGPLAAALLTLSIYLFARRRDWRLPLALAWVVGGAALLVSPESLREALLSFSGEAAKIEDARVITVGDEEYTYTSSDHRWLLFKVYAQPLARAGLVGYGSGGKIGLIDEDERGGLKQFYSIDNNYVAYTLKHGYLGIGLFVALAVVVAVRLAPVASRPGPLAPLAAGLLGAIVGVALGLATVGLSTDWAALWAFAVGLGVRTAELGRAGARPDAAAVPAREPARP
jgi:hypothetical protein